MKKLFYILSIILLITACKKENYIQKNLEKTKVEELKFDESLAKEYAADDYGMKKYVIAFLKRGPNRSQDSVTRVNLQKAHMANINKLAKEGKLILAGPFLGKNDLRGIYIFDVENIEEAKKLTETDPAIQTGSLEMELKEWYGSAALMAINNLHQKISKIKM